MPNSSTLDILRDSWVDDKKEPSTSVAWVLEMRDELDQMRELAVHHQLDVQLDTKHRFDRNTRERTFAEGDQVLVLLPVGHGKLAAQWQGPCSVIERVSPITYAIDMADKKKRKRILHVNMLKPWHSPVAAVMTVTVPDEEDADSDLITPHSDPGGTFTTDPTISTDQRQQLILQTDASERRLGGVLSQRDDQDVDRPIAFYSRKLLPRESRHSTVKKECLAIVASLRHFEPYLLGRIVTILTDHRALSYLDNMRTTNSRLTRWALAFQPFQFRVTYRPGSANSNADGLSRQDWATTPPDLHPQLTAQGLYRVGGMLGPGLTIYQERDRMSHQGGINQVLMN